MTQPQKPLPGSIDAALDLLGSADYLADRSLATVLFLALRMGRPLFLEGEAGVGKTEIAKVLAQTLGRRLILVSSRLRASEIAPFLRFFSASSRYFTAFPVVRFISVTSTRRSSPVR